MSPRQMHCAIQPLDGDLPPHRYPVAIPAIESTEEIRLNANILASVVDASLCQPARNDMARDSWRPALCYSSKDCDKRRSLEITKY